MITHIYKNVNDFQENIFILQIFVFVFPVYSDKTVFLSIFCGNIENFPEKVLFLLCGYGNIFHIYHIGKERGVRMGEYSFFALAFRMKYINRWGLMRNLRSENLTEHSAECAMLAHVLSEIGNTYFGKHYNPDRAAVCALYHDMSEIFTGDLPTPVKYFNDTIRDSYKQIEKDAVEKAIGKLPEELSGKYKSILEFEEDENLRRIVKAADKLSAYLKCVEEYRNGNNEFKAALVSTEKALEKLSEECEELKWFLDNFAKAFEKSLDEL